MSRAKIQAEVESVASEYGVSLSAAADALDEEWTTGVCAALPNIPEFQGQASELCQARRELEKVAQDRGTSVRQLLQELDLQG